MTITSHAELRNVAEMLLLKLQKKSSAIVCALSGDLGAGKTAFVKEIGRLLGVQEEITSPTFVIMKSYPVSQHSFVRTLTHIDAYRIEDADEMRVLGFQSLCADSTRLICIEWPERIPHILPHDAFHIHIQLNLDGTRTITW
jgi:tRNA threonylcarbamoyladenosine biosynthesis protein TsaE